MSSYQLLPQAEVALQHILDYRFHREDAMVIGVCGLPDLGKTTLCHTLAHVLERDYGLLAVTLSLEQKGQHPKLSLEKIIETIHTWKATKAYSIIFIEGTLLGYKALPSSHRVWSQLDDIYIRSLQRFNRSLLPLENTLYPLVDLFIQLSASNLEEWRPLLNKQLAVHQLYLERLSQHGFFDHSSRHHDHYQQNLDGNAKKVARHLVLVLDINRKLKEQHWLLDSSNQHLIESPSTPTSSSLSSSSGASSSKLSISTFSRSRRGWLWLPFTGQQPQRRREMITRLNPKVLISFAMMSLLGVLGYSRRLSVVLELINKFFML